MCSSALSLTSTLIGWTVVTPRPLYLRERDPVRIVQRPGGPQGRSGRVRKISAPPGLHRKVNYLIQHLYTLCHWWYCICTPCTTDGTAFVHPVPRMVVHIARKLSQELCRTGSLHPPGISFSPPFHLICFIEHPWRSSLQLLNRLRTFWKFFPTHELFLKHLQFLFEYYLSLLF
jgi:hypothetical protein